MISLVVIQPTSLCNINCNYCYVPDRKDKFIMSYELLETAIAKVLNNSLLSDSIEFLWHAGEPLTVGIPFYEKAVEFMKKHNRFGIKIHNTIQTNGIMLNDKWCEFFRNNDFQVGVSLDGPEFINDLNRVGWNGKSTHNKVMQGISYLKKHNIQFGIIGVLTMESLNYPKEVFDFFYQNEIFSVAFNVEEVENANISSSLSGNVLDTEEIIRKYENFIYVFYDLQQSHTPRVEVREFTEILSTIQNKISNQNYQRVYTEATDLAVLTIHKNGDISTYSPEFAGMKAEKYNNFIIGNIYNDEIDELYKNKFFLALQSDIHRSIKMCSETCLYFDFCGGASLSNKFSENGTLLSTETMTCKLHVQSLSKVVIDKLIVATENKASQKTNGEIQY